MAIHLMEISGKIANVVFYKLNGKLIARSAPSKARRTKAMKKRNSNFGIAASTGRLFRRAFAELIPASGNQRMHSRLAGAIACWIGPRDINDIAPETEILALRDFQFNSDCILSQLWKLRPGVTVGSDGILQVVIPNFVPIEAIIAPAGTFTVMIEIHAATVELAAVQQTAVRHCNTSFEVLYNGSEVAAQMIDLPLDVKPGSLTIIACGLRYRKEQREGILTDPGWLPAAVVEARYYQGLG